MLGGCRSGLGGDARTKYRILRHALQCGGVQCTQYSLIVICDRFFAHAEYFGLLRLQCDVVSCSIC